MRNPCLWMVAAVGLWSGAACVAADQPPRLIGTIDFFGLRTVPEAAVRKQLPFHEGDVLMDREHRPDGGAIALALGVSQVTLAYICCTPDQKVMVYVGIAEHPVKARVPSPTFVGKARLPDNMLRADDEYGAQVREAISRDQAREDDSQGHALGEYPPLRAVQQKFLDYARDHVPLLLEVLATSDDPRNRAVAADILGYAQDKRVAAQALARSAFDPDEGVRNNATRALGIIAEYSLAHPELAIRIDPQPFVSLLNSAVWTDLNKGIFVLMPLSAGRDPALIGILREQARPALIDICRWKNSGHSMPGCLVLRRVEGLPDFSGPDDRSEVLRKIDGG